MFLYELTEYFGSVAFGQVLSAAARGMKSNHFELDAGEVEPVVIGVRGRYRPTKAIGYLKAIPSVLRHIRKADYLYLFVPGSLPFVVAVCALLLRKHYGVYLRGEYGIDSRRVRFILSNADFVHANGPALRDKACRFCPDVELTVPMCDLTVATRVTDRVFKSEPPWNLLYVGRVEPRKGVAELIEAAHILKEHNVDFTLNIAGDGADLQKIKTESQAELSERVRILGLIVDRQELFSLYRSADLFVLPSHDEGFPRVLYEAMVFQTPIVTTFVGSIGSLMKPHINCLRIDVGDATGLASAIEMALNDIDLRRRLTRNASATIRDILETNDSKSLAKQVRDKVGVHAEPR
jgi:glycosyltransferase involved in cell wall biosynthesis